MRAALVALVVALLCGPALAAPVNSYPIVTPANSDTILGSQTATGQTVNFTALSLAQTLQSATAPWTQTQTFPAPTAITGSIVLTPGDITGFPPTLPTPPNGSMWTTTTNPALWVELGGKPTDMSPEGTSVKNYGANGNASEHYYCIIAASSNILGCTAGSFFASEVGNTVSVNGAGAAGGELITTVSTVSLASFTGTISGTALTISAVTGTPGAGMAIAGAGVTQGTYLVSGGGTSWTVNHSQNVGPVAMTGNLETLGSNASSSTTGLYWQGAIDGLDNTTPIQNAVTALANGQCLIFPKGIYLVQGTISLNGKQSVCLRGKGYNRTLTDGNTPQLVYLGATGPLLTIRTSAIGVKIDSLGLSYFGADYAGAGANLIVLGDSGSPSSQITIENSRIGGLSFVLQQAAGVSGTGQAGGANSLIQILGVFNLTIYGNTLLNAQTGILGPPDHLTNANGVTHEKNIYFGGFAGAPVVVSGEAWSDIDNIYEPYDDNISSTKHCGGIVAVTASNTPFVNAMLIEGDQFLDASSNAGKCIDLSTNGSSSVLNGVAVIGNQLTIANEGIILGTGQGYSVKGNSFNGLTTAIDSSASAVTAAGDFSGNAYTTVTNRVISSGLIGPFQIDTAAPTVTSGLGTLPTVAANSVQAFTITVGAGGSPGTTEILAMPSAPVGWTCTAVDSTSNVTARQTGAESATTATFTWSGAPSNSDLIRHSCIPH